MAGSTTSSHPSIFARLFVLLVFAVLAVSFWGTTGLLYWEYSSNWRQPSFEGALWFDLLTHYSHKFLFFPLFGTIALFAFYLPAVVFVEMYWRHAQRPENEIPFAKFRFVTGFVGAIALSAGISYFFSLGDETALWQIERRQLLETNVGTGVCARIAPDGRCERVTFPTALANVRRVSQERAKLTDLKRNCFSDPLIQPPSEPERKRFCFVTSEYSRDARDLEGKLLNDTACCTALARFESHARQVHSASADNRSLLDRVQNYTLGLKIFFLIVILIISVLLAARRNRIQSQYAHLAHRIDRGVLIGTVAMLFLPVMNHAYLLSTELIYGPNDILATGHGVSFYRTPYLLSIAFGIWGFFIMLFFVRRDDKEAEGLSKIMGTIASGIFVLKYDEIVDYAVRYAGPGAGNYSVIGLVALAGAMWLLLVLLKAFQSSPPDKKKGPE